MSNPEQSAGNGKLQLRAFGIESVSSVIMKVSAVETSPVEAKRKSSDNKKESTG